MLTRSVTQLKQLECVCSKQFTLDYNPQIAMLSTWTIWYCISTILVAHVHLKSVLANNTSCPPWFYYSNTTQQCECAILVGKIHCNQQDRKVVIADGYCATSTEQESQYYSGPCPFRHTENNTDRMFSELPSNLSLLNGMMCGPYNRKGLLCGRCIDEYGPAVYSLDMKCINCSRLSTGYSISLYLFLEVFPVTLFFMCVVFFRLNITAGPLLGYVLFCQVYVIFLQRDLFLLLYTLSHVSAPLRVLLYPSLTLSGSWLLQFGRFVIPPFCISEKLTGIHIQMLSLVTSIYPTVLVVITCILMELHARNYTFIHKFWNPFSIILNKLKITSVTGDAVVHAFATFILLTAYTLTYNVSTLVQPNPVYRSTDETPYKSDVLYSDPTIVWLSHKHILYMLAAVVPFIFLVLIPSLLLCVYPTKIYSSLSRCVSARKQLAIKAFAEALHNCFKDGLNGTRDYRALAGLLILLNIVGPLFSTFIGTYVTKGYSFDFTAGLVLIFLSLIFSYMRPCKLMTANLSLSYHSMMLGILSIAVHLWKKDMSTGTETLEGTLIIVPVVSHILVLMWAMYTFIHRIMSHFGYQFDFKEALTGLANVVKQLFHGSYQVLPDTATQ